MKKEIKAAVGWWADQLRSVPEHDNGVGLDSAFARMAAKCTRPEITEDHIERFAEELADRWRARTGDNWYPDDPLRGGYLRTVATDYGPSVILAESMAAAGIENNRLVLPIKTVMWIDPGKVSVSCGYGAGVEVIYEGDKRFVKQKKKRGSQDCAKN